MFAIFTFPAVWDGAGPGRADVPGQVLPAVQRACLRGDARGVGPRDPTDQLGVCLWVYEFVGMGV
jgi:hypothetical protein